VIRNIATFGAIGLTVAFVAVFFVGHSDSKHLTEVAPRSGLSYDELMEIGPRVATQTGVTLGTSRHVIYLLACSGQATKTTLEAQATQASTLAKQQRLSDREAVTTVLAQRSSVAADSLKGC
jgi:hypothetical protein